MTKNYRVALIGLDGCGKSTNIKEMTLDEEYADYSFMWVRWEPKLLKPAYWFLGQKVKKFRGNRKKDKIQSIMHKTSESDKKLSEEYNQKSKMKEKIFKYSIIRKVWLLLALIDYLFQFYFKTFRLLIKRKKIIFDRFYLDLFVDQGINFGYTPDKIAREIKRYQWLFPKMDKIIYIRVSPQTCYIRKDDIPGMDYLLKRYNIYEYLSQNSLWDSVDGECSFEIVNKSIKKIIFEQSYEQ